MGKIKDHNLLTMIGRLTNSPEMRHTSDGTPVCHFRLANNRGERDGKQLDANFFNCEAWKNVADIIYGNLDKGRKVFIEGSLNLDRWNDKTGAPKSSVKIIVHHITFLDKKNENTDG